MGNCFRRIRDGYDSESETHTPADRVSFLVFSPMLGWHFLKMVCSLLASSLFWLELKVIPRHGLLEHHEIFFVGLKLAFFILRQLGLKLPKKKTLPVQHYQGPYSQNGYGGHEGDGCSPRCPGPDTVPVVVGFRAFYRDLKEFQTTIEVPKGLSNYVSASRTSQRLWFFKLLAAWKRKKPAPASTEDVAQLILQTVQGYSNIQGLLKFYHLPWPIVSYSQPLPERVTKLLLVPATQPLPVLVNKPYREKPKASGTWPVTPEAAKGVQYQIHTLPVKWNKDKGDGDGFTVFVNVVTDPRETELLPEAIQKAALLRHKARAQKNYKMADALQKKIEDADYKCLMEKMVELGVWRTSIESA